MSRPETRRALYQQRREAGLCPACGGKREGQRVKCLRCRRGQNKHDAKRRGAPRRDKLPEKTSEGPPMKLWQMLEYESATAGATPSAGPVKKEPEADPLALAPEIEARAWALRIGLGLAVRDDEADEFRLWGPGPKAQTIAGGSEP